MNCPPGGDEFSPRWGAHDVRLHGAAVQHLHHEVVGHLDLTYENGDMASESRLNLIIYAAEPASTTADALTLLASWAPSHGASRQLTANPCCNDRAIRANPSLAVGR